MVTYIKKFLITVSFDFLNFHPDLPDPDLTPPEVRVLKDGAPGAQPPDVLHQTEKLPGFT